MLAPGTVLAITGWVAEEGTGGVLGAGPRADHGRREPRRLTEDMTDRTTVDFDHHDAEWHAGRVGHWEELRRCPVAYNEPTAGSGW